MTIASEIQRIKTNIANAYDALENKGATMPATEDSANLALTVATVPAGGDEITATNTTGSAVSADDRVWVNGEDVYTRDFTTQSYNGNSPIINDETKVLTLSKTGTHIYKNNSNQSSPTQSVEVVIKAKLIDYQNVSGNIPVSQFFRDSNSSTGGTIPCNIHWNSSGLQTRINDSVAQSWQLSPSASSIQKNVWYYYRIQMTSTHLTQSYSLDGISWENTVDTNTTINFSGKFSGKYFLVGIGNGNNFQMELDLSECYVKVDGQTVWTPYTTSTTYSIINDTDITSTSFTGIAQEAIANNATGSVKTLLDGNGTYAPTTATKSITVNGTYTASAENAYGLSEVTVDVPTPDIWHNWRTDAVFGIKSSDTFSSVQDLTDIVSSSNMYIGYKNGTASYIYSIDGVNWNSGTFPSPVGYCRCVDNGFIFTNNSDDSKIMFSPDGINWTEVTLESANWGYCIYNNETFILSNITGTTKVYISTDGIHWTKTLDEPYDYTVIGMVYGNGVIVLVRRTTGSSVQLRYSEDNGETWKSDASINAYSPGAICFANGKFVVTGNYNTKAAYSINGKIWTTVDLTRNTSWSTCIGTSRAFLTSDSSTNANYSSDGITWSSVTLPASSPIVWNDMFFVKNNQTLYYSTDAQTWYSLSLSSDFVTSTNISSFNKQNTAIVASSTTTDYSTLGDIFSEVYTLTASPTTSTQVYEIPKKTSALTITAVGTGTITLSDSKVYNRNSAGDVQSPVLGTKTITSNNTYTAASDYLDGFSSVTVDVPGITREVSQQGVYQMPLSSFTFSLPSNATDVGDYGLSSAFRYCTALTSVDLSSLTTVSGSSGLSSTFQGCTSLTSVSFPSLATLSGSSAFNYAFSGCTGLTSVDLSSLTTVSGDKALYYAFSGCTGLTSLDLSSLITVSGSNGLAYAFQGCIGLTSIDLSSLTTVSDEYGLASVFKGCTALTSVNFSALTTLSGSAAFQGAFYGCTALTDIYFPALTTTSFGSYTNQFTNMLGNTGNTTTHTLHFPSNLQSTISGLTGAPNFGGTAGRVVYAWDLPATS